MLIASASACGVAFGAGLELAAEAGGAREARADNTTTPSLLW
jgi:hypothetical protein